MGSSYTNTYEEEEQLFIQAIRVSLEKTPEKNNEYFLNTLNEVAVGLQNYDKAKERVIFLRNQTRYALDDLRHLDHKMKCPIFCDGNNAAYVEEVLERGLVEGLAAKTDKQEEYALNHVAASSIYLLDDSTFRRDHACAKKVLESALEISNLEVKRNLVRDAVSYLENRLICRQY